jgi:hypothetical protein
MVRGNQAIVVSSYCSSFFQYRLRFIIDLENIQPFFETYDPAHVSHDRRPEGVLNRDPQSNYVHSVAHVEKRL